MRIIAAVILSVGFSSLAAFGKPSASATGDIPETCKNLLKQTVFIAGGGGLDQKCPSKEDMNSVRIVSSKLVDHESQGGGRPTKNAASNSIYNVAFESTGRGTANMTSMADGSCSIKKIDFGGNTPKIKHKASGSSAEEADALGEDEL